MFSFELILRTAQWLLTGVGIGWIDSGGFDGGRTPLGPDQKSQLSRQVFMKLLNAVSLAFGTSSFFTWLGEWKQLLKHLLVMNQRGHMRV